MRLLMCRCPDCQNFHRHVVLNKDVTQYLVQCCKCGATFFYQEDELKARIREHLRKNGVELTEEELIKARKFAVAVHNARPNATIKEIVEEIWDII